MLSQTTSRPTPTRGFLLNCTEFTTLKRDLPATLRQLLLATRRPFLFKEDVLRAFRRRGVAVTLEMLNVAIHLLAVDYPDGKRRMAGIQVKTLFDQRGRWYDVFRFEQRPAA